MDLSEIKITKHAQERYAARIMQITEDNEIKQFIQNNEEKIHTDICKMITYGQLIYSGRQRKDNKICYIDVYNKDTWVVLVDKNTKNVITLYKIILGCEEEFNQLYVTKMLENINKATKKLSNIKAEVDEENNTYKEYIKQNEEQIKEYRGFIKQLDNLNNAYDEVISNNVVKVSQAERKLADVVNKLINKKEF